MKCPRDFRIALGDSLVISLPPEDSGIVVKVYMGDGGALSKPSLEQVQVQKGKRGKQAGSDVRALAVSWFTDTLVCDGILHARHALTMRRRRYSLHVQQHSTTYLRDGVGGFKLISRWLVLGSSYTICKER